MANATSTLTKLLYDKVCNKQVTAFVRTVGSGSWEPVSSVFVSSVEEAQECVSTMKCQLPECKNNTCDVVFVVSNVSWVDRSL